MELGEDEHVPVLVGELPDGSRERSTELRAVSLGLGRVERRCGEVVFEGLDRRAPLSSFVLDQARRSESWAKATRLIAWLFTAIGALMIGGWKRLLPGFRDEGEGEP